MTHARMASSTDTFRHLVEQSPFGVHIVNADFRLIHVSAGAQKVFENVQPLIGRDFAEVLRIIWPEPFASEAIALYRRTLETGEPYHAPSTIERRRDVDEIASFDWKIERLLLPNGSFGVVCHFYDLSDRQRYEQALRDSEARLRRSEQRFRRLAEAMPQLVWMAEDDGTVTYYNSQIARYDGIEADADGHWNWQGTVHPDDLPSTLAAWQRAVAEGGLYECQQRMRMADGSYRWHLSRAHCVERQQWFGTATDVHDLKEAQEHLRERERELQRLNVELSAASRRKDEFLAMLGHELRNPLAAIRSATALLKLMSVGDERLQRTQGVLERQSTHMTRLIDGLLEVSRVARGKIRLEPEIIDLREIVDVLVHDQATQIRARGLTLKHETSPAPLWVFADPVRLAQIFDNLLGNAIKFTQTHGSISVTLREDRGVIVVRIRDTGVGIRPEMLEHVFEPFRQEISEIHGSAGGLGLGLALAKALVELHHGTIRAHSAGLGAGTELEVRLPSASAPPSKPRVERATRIAARRLLIVEDNPDAGQTLHALLDSLGHDVNLAETGTRALEILRDVGAELVLCDLGLPDMSGHDVARAIRADPTLRQTYLVALTGYGQPEDRRRTADAGFDDHLTKPVSIAELESVLARLTG